MDKKKVPGGGREEQPADIPSNEKKQKDINEVNNGIVLHSISLTQNF